MLVAVAADDDPPSVPRSRMPPVLVHAKACGAPLAVAEAPTTWPDALTPLTDEAAPPRVMSTSPPASVQLKPCSYRKSLEAVSEKPMTCPDALIFSGQE